MLGSGGQTQKVLGGRRPHLNFFSADPKLQIFLLLTFGQFIIIGHLLANMCKAFSQVIVIPRPLVNGFWNSHTQIPMHKQKHWERYVVNMIHIQNHMVLQQQ